jgi:hypothetical protein
MTRKMPAHRLFETALDLARSAVAAGELATASGSVIARRSALMGAALADPVGADHREFARMAPEKVDALSLAATAAFGRWWGIQREWIDYATEEAAHAMRTVAEFSLTPTPLHALEAQANYVAGVLDRAAHHGASITASALAASDATILPIHRRATANARRLARKRR